MRPDTAAETRQAHLGRIILGCGRERETSAGLPAVLEGVLMKKPDIPKFGAGREAMVLFLVAHGYRVEPVPPPATESRAVLLHVISRAV